MTPDIIRKLTAQLNSGITTEVQVVYLMVGIRKLIERDGLEEQYRELKFHCDWVLHSSMDRAAAKAILREFDNAHALLRDGVELHDLPGTLRSEIDRILNMGSLEVELSRFLEDHELPLLTQHRSDGWAQFLRLYGKVIEDIPLQVRVPAAKQDVKQVVADSELKHISHVTVRCETAQETVKMTDREEVVFRLTWTVHDKEGPSGTICVYNTHVL